MNEFGNITIGGIAFHWLDVLALAWFILAWTGYAAIAERMIHRAPNLMSVMNHYRLLWMREMLKRDNRIADITLVGNLLRSISFFASTSIFLLLGLVTLFGYSEKAIEVLSAIPFAMPGSPFMWEIKIFLLSIIFIYAFFKYTWSLRQYNYACIYVGAAPASSNTSLHEEYAQKGARLTSNAAKHFNMGLRAYYFGLAALSWFVHAWALIAATAWVLYVLYRREFRSHTLNNLAQPGI